MRGRKGHVGKRIAIASLALVVWWLGRRLWPARRTTPGEQTASSPPSRSQAAPPDPVDEAIAESFPASDPPSYAGSGHPTS
ncbi:MAG: hypothetical protein ACLFWM_04990 [Actinomycetota bacterium]